MLGAFIVSPLHTTPSRPQQFRQFGFPSQIQSSLPPPPTMNSNPSTLLADLEQLTAALMATINQQIDDYFGKIREALLQRNKPPDLEAPLNLSIAKQQKPADNALPINLTVDPPQQSGAIKAEPNAESSLQSQGSTTTSPSVNQVPSSQPKPAIKSENESTDDDYNSSSSSLYRPPRPLSPPPSQQHQTAVPNETANSSGSTFILRIHENSAFSRPSPSNRTAAASTTEALVVNGSAAKTKRPIQMLENKNANESNALPAEEESVSAKRAKTQTEVSAVVKKNEKINGKMKRKSSSSTSEHQNGDKSRSSSKSTTSSRQQSQQVQPSTDVHVHSDEEDEEEYQQNLYFIKAIDCRQNGCTDRVTSRKQLKYHLIEKHKLRPYQCPQCFERFKSRRQLQTHFSDDHSSLTKWTCPHPGCYTERHSFKSFDEHYFINHHRGTYLCPLAQSTESCSFKAVYINAVLTHVSACHSQLKSGGVVKTGKSCSDKFLIDALKCTHCEEWLMSRSALKKHLYEEHNRRPYYCVIEQCEKSYNSRNELFDHCKAKHDTKSQNQNHLWHCTVCPSDQAVSYRLSASLNEHHFIAHCEGSFTCSLCRFKAKYRGLVIDHFDATHGRGEQ